MRYGIITLGQAKLLLSIPAEDTSRDDLIEELIRQVEADYERIRNKPFDTTGYGKPIYPKGAALTAAQMIQFHLNGMRRTGIAAQSLGDHSVTFTGELMEGYPKSIVGKIRRYVGFK